MGSSSVMSGWWGGVVSSLFDLFGEGGSVTSVHVVRACLVRSQRLSNFRPHFFMRKEHYIFHRRTTRR